MAPTRGRGVQGGARREVRSWASTLQSGTQTRVATKRGRWGNDTAAVVFVRNGKRSSPLQIFEEQDDV